MLRKQNWNLSTCGFGGVNFASEIDIPEMCGIHPRPIPQTIREISPITRTRVYGVNISARIGRQGWEGRGTTLSLSLSLWVSGSVGWRDEGWPRGRCCKSKRVTGVYWSGLLVGTGTGQPVNGAIPSLPSPTMPNFNMAAQTPNGQPAGSDPGVYTNGIPQTYPGREYQLRRSVPPLRNARPIDAGLYYFAFAMRSG